MTKISSLSALLAIPAVLAAGYTLAQAPVPPTPPAENAASEVLRIEGTVREIFGNKFIVEDASGRKLIETGPGGSASVRVAVGDRVTVEGQARDGFVHASAVTLANGQRVILAGPPPGRGPDRRAFDTSSERTVLDAVQRAGFRDARVTKMKKRHAEVVANDSAGRSWELHVEFDGRIRKQESITRMNDADVKALVERAGYTSVSSMRPEKKHIVVTAMNSRGERVEIDVHRDGTIKKEKRLF